jgi:hypothetical protein
MLNEYQMIQKVNQVIAQQGLGPEYRVIKTRGFSSGLVCYWIPNTQDKSLSGYGPYIVHQNGTIKEWNELSYRNRINPTDVELVLATFKNEAERVTRV